VFGENHPFRWIDIGRDVEKQITLDANHALTMSVTPEMIEQKAKGSLPITGTR
jgi:hypothetical protein